MNLLPNRMRDVDPQDELPADQRRRHGRVRCQDIGCSLGYVLDVSASGMRVQCGSKPPAVGKEFTTTVEGLDGGVVFRYIVVWTRRSGLMQYEVGIEFRELDPTTRQALARLARASAQNDYVRRRAA